MQGEGGHGRPFPFGAGGGVNFVGIVAWGGGWRVRARTIRLLQSALAVALGKEMRSSWVNLERSGRGCGQFQQKD